MQAGSGAPGSSAVPDSGTLAIVAALASERRAFSGIAPAAGRWFLRQSGPGPAAARAAALAAIDRGASALMSWGLAGGLAPEIAAGTVVVPHDVVSSDGRPIPTATRWRERLEAGLPGTVDVSSGSLAAADLPVTSARDKAGLAAALDAVAVDTESYAIAEVARESGVPFVAVRVVIDRRDDELPADIASFVTPAGNVRVHRALLSALTSGANRRMLRVLARRSAIAHGVLRQVAESLASIDFAREADRGQVPA